MLFESIHALHRHQAHPIYGGQHGKIMHESCVIGNFCPWCMSTFTSYEGARQHVRNSFRVGYCNVDQNLYNSHMEDFANIQCLLCDHVLIDNYEYSWHIRNHFGSAPDIVCDDLFTETYLDSGGITRTHTVSRLSEGGKCVFPVRNGFGPRSHWKDLFSSRKEGTHRNLSKKERNRRRQIQTTHGHGRTSRLGYTTSNKGVEINCSRHVSNASGLPTCSESQGRHQMVGGQQEQVFGTRSLQRNWSPTRAHLEQSGGSVEDLRTNPGQISSDGLLGSEGPVQDPWHLAGCQVCQDAEMQRPLETQVGDLHLGAISSQTSTDVTGDNNLHHLERPQRSGTRPPWPARNSNSVPVGRSRPSREQFNRLRLPLRDHDYPIEEDPSDIMLSFASQPLLSPPLLPAPPSSANLSSCGSLRGCEGESVNSTNSFWGDMLHTVTDEPPKQSRASLPLLRRPSSNIKDTQPFDSASLSTCIGGANLRDCDRASDDISSKLRDVSPTGLHLTAAASPLSGDGTPRDGLLVGRESSRVSDTYPAAVADGGRNPSARASSQTASSRVLGVDMRIGIPAAVSSARSDMSALDLSYAARSVARAPKARGPPFSTLHGESKPVLARAKSCSNIPNDEVEMIILRLLHGNGHGTKGKD